MTKNKLRYILAGFLIGSLAAIAYPVSADHIGTGTGPVVTFDATYERGHRVVVELAASTTGLGEYAHCIVWRKMWDGSERLYILPDRSIHHPRCLRLNRWVDQAHDRLGVNATPSY